MRIISRVKRLEDDFEMLTERRGEDMNKRWESLTPDVLDVMKKAVEVFVEHFPDRLSQNQWYFPSEDFPREQMNLSTAKNFANIIVIIILAMYQAQIGIKEQENFLREIRKFDDLSVALDYAKHSFDRHQEK